MNTSVFDPILDEEVGDIILYDLYDQNPKGNDLRNVQSILDHYSLKLSEDRLNVILENLRKVFLIRRDPNDSSAVSLTDNGIDYVKRDIIPKTSSIGDLELTRIESLIRDYFRIEEFQITPVGDGFKVTYFPGSHISRNFFSAFRNKNAYYIFQSDPSLELYRRSDRSAIYKAFEKWLTMLTIRGEVALPWEDRIFAVGSFWSGDDRTEKFLIEGIWINGHDEQFTELVNSIEPNDTLILKSTFAKGNVTYLRVKATGKVTENLKDGHTLKVSWLPHRPYIDIAEMGYLRKAIHRLREDQTKKILDAISDPSANAFLIEEQVQEEDPIVEEPIQSDNIDEEYNTNVKLQHDNLADKDLLGRQPFIDAIAAYIKDIWQEQSDGPYSIHLQGEWGSGKSNTLKFLRERLEENGWIVAEYNAWENQHFAHPWWSLMNVVYSQSRKGSRNWVKRTWIWIKEKWWRLFWINWLNCIAFVVLMTLTFLAIKNAPGLFERKSQDLETLSVVFSLVGATWAFVNWIKSSLFVNLSNPAHEFKKSINDPLASLKKHFKTVINYSGKNVAIIIEDIDRCHSANVVKVLEGIQTVFKDAKVLYMIAGDGAWVRQCFELEYELFSDTMNKPGATLGNLFQEKIFQMTISLPALSRSQIEQYFKSLLNCADPNAEPDENEQARIKIEIETASSEKEIQKVIDQYKDNPEKSKIAVNTAVAQMSTEERKSSLQHQLVNYISLVPNNVRSIKRFINNYAIMRQTLMLQGVSFLDVDFETLIRWLLLASKFPKIANDLQHNPKHLNEIVSQTNDDHLTELAKGLNEKSIRLIVGK